MSIRERMSKLAEAGTPTYKSKLPTKGNVSGGPEKKALSSDEIDMKITGAGRAATAKKPAGLPTPGENTSKGLDKVAKEAGKVTQGKGANLNVRGRMEALLGDSPTLEEALREVVGKHVQLDQEQADALIQAIVALLP